MYTAAMQQAGLAFSQYLLDAGRITDELEDVNAGASQGVLLSYGTTVSDPLDERILATNVTVDSYSQLQAVRTLANQAIGALATYDTATVPNDSLKVLRGELYAMEGYAEIMLADLFCSGVPLSTLDFQKDFTYAAGSTTNQLYQDAVAKFNQALSLSRTNDSVTHLAQIGRGRAYLDLGEYSAAADDVTTVPSDFVYQDTIPWKISGTAASNFQGAEATVSNREGRNGIPYRTSGDPRTAVVGAGYNAVTEDSLFIPDKYKAVLSGSSGYTPFTLASGVEARLVQAEAALHRSPNDGAWLGMLNGLRTAHGLTPLVDPVDPATRIDTLFTERAAWLFLDSHRQGDLRRLLRQYGQYARFSSQDVVYPTGPYSAPGSGVYGADVVAPVPQAEYANPYFHGCFNENP